MRCKYFLVFLFILFLSFASATYTLSNSSISTKYSPSSFLSGNLEISFIDEPFNSLFTDSLGNSFSLEEVLKKASNYKYTCDLKNCEKNYTFNPVGTPSKNFHLDKGKSAIFGFVLGQDITKINSIDFDLYSDVKPSDKNQIEIDFLDDGEIEIMNNKKGSLSGDPNYGCYSSSGGAEKEVIISSTPYCQKVELPQSPGFYIGGEIKEEISESNAEINASLYSLSGKKLYSCSLTPSGSWSFEGCDIELSLNSPEEYYVCVSSNGIGKFKTKAYTSTLNSFNCGFFGIPPKTESNSYKLGFRKFGFGSISNLEINNDFNPEKNLSQIIQDYLQKEYSLKCSSGCEVPIKVHAIENQSLDLSNLRVSYEGSLGGSEENDFYLAKENIPKVNSNKQKLSLNKIFELPKEKGNYTYQLFFNGEPILSKEITIQEISFFIAPLRAALGFPVKFLVKNVENQSVIQYEWDFGEGIKKSSQGEYTFVFEKIGIFPVTVSLLTNLGKFTKEFEVTVDSPEEMISKTIETFDKNLKNFETEIEKRSDFERAQIEKIVNASSLKEKVETIKVKNSTGAPQEEIISLLLSTKVPNSISQVSQNAPPYFIKEENVDLDALEEITAESFSDVKEEDIVFWATDSVEIEGLKKVDSIYFDSEEKKINFFEINIKEKENLGDYTFFIKKEREFEFENENFELDHGFYFATFNGPEKIIFSTSEDISFSDLKIFMAPPLSELSLIEKEFQELEDKKLRNTLIIGGIFIVLIFVGIIVYLFLQRWYKTKYEKFLFPNQNQFYNMITYVHNAKKQKTPNSEIRRNLKHVGWNGEQITYVMKKYAGERTGMYELPVGKILQKKKEKDTNINKRPKPFRY